MVSGGLKATVVSASSGAVATAFVVAPFDVVKTRIHIEPTSSPRRVLTTVLRQEGVGALWSGLRPSLLMTVPASVIYFSAYEHIRMAVASDERGSEEIAPVLAAAGAKLLASTATAPLELMRTRMQADRAFAQEGIVGGATALVRREGLSALFKGLGPTLIRDVPFSCVYWLGYERLKLLFVESQSKPPHPHLHEHQHVSLSASFVAGGLAGAAATLLTMPLDVVKTRMQVAGVVSGVVSGPLLAPLHSAAGAAGAAGVGTPAGGAVGGGLSTAAMMARIARLEGPRALLAGTVPRLAKMAPSCAIMIASFEMGKRWIEPSLR